MTRALLLEMTGSGQAKEVQPFAAAKPPASERSDSLASFGASVTSEEQVADPFAEAATSEQPTLDLRGGDEPYYAAIADMLSTLPLFRGCSHNLLEGVALHAQRVKLETNQALGAQTSKCWYIVESGALQLCVGPGPSKVVGPGTSLNVLGMMGLYKVAEQYRPHNRSRDNYLDAESKLQSPYEVLDFHGTPPMIFEDPSTPTDTFVFNPSSHTLTGDELCLFNLCPHASTQPVHVRDRLRRSSWMRWTASGAPPTFSPAEGKMTNGATLLSVPASCVEALRRSALSFTENDVQVRKGVEQFRKNCTHLERKWRILMSKCAGTLFPGAPLEVLGAVAEISVLISKEPGAELVVEGTTGDDGESIFVIDSGVATVEKQVTQNGTCAMKQIGRLRSGAIIGDIALIGAAIPRAATVRAKTRVDALFLPALSLLGILERFPGIISAMSTRIVAATNFMQQALPTHTESLCSLRLFAGCSLTFVNEVASRGIRRMLFCGEAVMVEGSEQGTMYVLEYGRCGVEVQGKGYIADVPMGNCFGERTLLGISKTANATVRVQTPNALVLSVPRNVLQEALAHFPAELEHFEHMKREPLEGRVRGGQVAHVQVFRNCSGPFIEALAESVALRSYMPGQTVVVEGAEESMDEAHMYVITGGKVSVERVGHPSAELTAGATFGELALLGFAQKRTSTIRAITFCFLLEIPRSSFMKALKKFPEEDYHFKELLETKAAIPWPCLQDVSSRVLYLLDLYSEHRSNEQGDDRMWTIKDSAILVLRGHVGVLDQDGEVTEYLDTGRCLNQQVLLGVPDESGVTVQPSADCRVSLLSNDVLCKVTAECPEEEDKIRRSIMRYLIAASERKLGFDAQSPGPLQLSALFRSLSGKLMEHARKLLESRFYVPGALVISPGVMDKCFCLVLDGKVRVECKVSPKEVSSGEVLGESILLGTAVIHRAPVRAVNLSLIQLLDKRIFDKHFSIDEFRDDYQRIETFREDASTKCNDDHWLHTEMSKSIRFANSDPEYLSILCDHAEEVFFAPGDIILQGGADVKTEAPCYILLAGEVEVESRSGVCISTVRGVEIFGERSVLGDEISSSASPKIGHNPALVGGRTASVFAWRKGLVHCARIPGSVFRKAFERFPREQEFLADLWRKRGAAAVEIERQRHQWLEELAVPALAENSLFEASSQQFLWVLATALQEKRYNKGDVIVTAGDPAHTMLIVLEGGAELLAKSGTFCGKITAGAAVGEVALLGLLATRTATLRALGDDCRVMEVTSDALKKALSGQCAGHTADRLRRIIKVRQEQVEHGHPIIAMGIGSVDDVAIRAIALHAKRRCFKRGAVWEPLPDTHHSGPYISVLLHGKAQVEIAQAVTHEIVQLKPGGLFLEGLAAGFGASVRALTDCELYQVSQNDINIAVSATKSAQDWFYLYRLMVKDTTDHLNSRLVVVRRMAESLAPHACDEQINSWKARRQKSIKRAKQLAQARLDTALRLPYIHPPPVDKEDEEEMEDVKASAEDKTIILAPNKDISASLKSIKGELPPHRTMVKNSLAVYSCLRLPMLQEMGHAKAFHSKSEPRLPKLPPSATRLPLI